MNFNKIKSDKKFIIIIVIIIVGIFLIYAKYINKDDKKETVVEDFINNEQQDIEEKFEKSGSNKEEQENKNVCVHISGAVKNSGIVVLEENARIIDAIEAAGGLTEKADISNVNLAFIIADGIKIYIPSAEDVENVGLNYLSNDGGKNIVEQTIIDDKVKSEKININTASKTELESLTGIGPSTADKIIEFRKSNGKFKSIDELKNVVGIGDSKLNAIKNNIYIK